MKIIDVVEKQKITIDICTKDRYYTTLPLLLYSLAIQKNLKKYIKEIIIYDDSEKLEKINEIFIIENILKIISVPWQVIIGKKKGQVIGHQIIKDISTTDLIWRIDDDEILSNQNFLQRLIDLWNHYVSTGKTIGAISYCIINPKNVLYTNNVKGDVNYLNDINNNFQWYIAKYNFIRYAEHLYSSFLYDKTYANNYPLLLSPVGHREETIFTHEIYQNNAQLIIEPKLIMYHFRNTKGGLRHYKNPDLWNHDEKEFKNYLYYINAKKSKKIIILDNGIGDHWAFKSVYLEEFQLQTLENMEIACCYPDIFKNLKNVKIISIQQAINKYGKYVVNKYNIYRFMDKIKKEKKIKLTLQNAFKKMYLWENTWPKNIF